MRSGQEQYDFEHQEADEFEEPGNIFSPILELLKKEKILSHKWNGTPQKINGLGAKRLQRSTKKVLTDVEVVFFDKFIRKTCSCLDSTERI